MNAQAKPFLPISKNGSNIMSKKVNKSIEQEAKLEAELEPTAFEASAPEEGQEEEEESRPPPYQVMRILRRENKRHNSLHRGSSSDSGEGSDAVDQRRTMSIEERELAYGLARARIFADDADVIGDSSRSGASSPKSEVGSKGEAAEALSLSTTATGGTTTEVSKGKGKKFGSIENTGGYNNNTNNNNAGPGSKANNAHKISRQQPKPKPQFRPPAAMAQMYGHPAMFNNIASPYGVDAQGHPLDPYSNMNNVPQNFSSYAFNPYKGRPPPVPTIYDQPVAMVRTHQSFHPQGILNSFPGQGSSNGVGQVPYKLDNYYPGSENLIWPPASTYPSPMSNAGFPVGHGVGSQPPSFSPGNPTQQSPVQQRFARPLQRPSPRRQEVQQHPTFLANGAYYNPTFNPGLPAPGLNMPVSPYGPISPGKATSHMNARNANGFNQLDSMSGGPHAHYNANHHHQQQQQQQQNRFQQSSHQQLQQSLLQLPSQQQQQQPSPDGLMTLLQPSPNYSSNYPPLSNNPSLPPSNFHHQRPSVWGASGISLDPASIPSTTDTT